MAREVINVGASPNDGQGDPIRTSFIKCNNNFGELYSRVQTSPPPTLIGSPGDVAGMTAYDSLYFYYCFQDYDGSSIIWGQINPSAISQNEIYNGSSNVVIPASNGNVSINVNGNPSAVFGTNITFTGNLLPAANITYNLGSPTQAFKDLYLVGSTIYLDAATISANANSMIFTNPVGGQFVVAGTGGGGASDIEVGNLVALANVTAGNISTTALTTTGIVNLGSVANVKITGGTNGYVLQTDGVGGLSWTAQSGGGAGNGTPGGANTQIQFNDAGSFGGNAGFTFDKGTGAVTATGNVSAGNLSAINITGTLTTAAQPNVTSVGTLTSLSVSGNANVGNLGTTGIITASGNITGSYFFGNGSLLTGLSTTSISNGTSNVVVAASGNVTISVAGVPNVLTVTSTGANVDGTLNVTGNANVGNLGATNVVTTNLTGTLQTAAQTNITSVGTLGSLSVTGNASTGNVSGTTGTFTDVAGTLTTAAQPNITSVGTLGSLTVTGNVGTGNVSGTTGTFTNVAGTLTTASQTNITSVGTLGSLSVTGNVSTGNVSGTTGTFTNVAGTLTTAAQTSITSVGTLSSLSVTGNVTSGNLSVSTGTITGGNLLNANANGVGNIGSSTAYFNTVFAMATSAQYADIAESYASDADYEPGTVVKFGGDKEVTLADQDLDPCVAGVITTKPAYLMNAGLEGEYVAKVALTGRVPCKVLGKVNKGQMLVSAGGGYARAETHPAIGTVIGKALQNFDGYNGIIEVVVGRL